MPTSFSGPKTATKPNPENQPPYAAVSARTKPQHMVVFSNFELASLPQGMKNPRFSDRGWIYKVWFSSAGTNMGQQSNADILFSVLFAHKKTPFRI